MKKLVKSNWELVVSLTAGLVAACLLLWSAPAEAQQTLVPRPVAQAPLVAPQNLWRVVGDFLVPANGTLFVPLPGNVATLPNGIIVQDGLDVVITDAFTGGAELVNIVRGAQAGGGNQVLVLGDQAVMGYHSSTGVSLQGDTAAGVGLGLRKATQGGADVVVRIAVSGRVAP